MRCASGKLEFLNLNGGSKLSGGEVSIGKSEDVFKGVKYLKCGCLNDVQCTCHVSITKLSNVEALQSLLFDLLKDANHKMKSLEVEKSKLVE
jgi:hypothetical protein